MLNSKQVEELFARESILMGDSDVMPFSTAIELVGVVGNLAFDVMINHMDAKRHLRIFGDTETDYHAVCFTFEGFQDFVSYTNIFELNHIAEKLSASDRKVIDFQVVHAHREKPKARAEA